MKAGLHLQLSQQLKMTPQLQQAIKLLQLSTLDLQQEIQTALESNPMLELIENPPAKEAEDREASESLKEVDGSDREALQETDSIPDDLSVDVDWDDVYQPSYTGSSGGSQEPLSDEFKFDSQDDGTLADHLVWQLNLSSLGERDKTIAFAIIESLDDDGYLESTIEDITEAAARQLEVEVATDDEEEGESLQAGEVEAVLKFVQSFDPVGVAAKNLKECLQLQLIALDDTLPAKDAALRIISDHLDLLGNRDYARLLRVIRLPEEAVKDAIRLIQTLDPKPGQRFAPNQAEYIVPDVFVRKEGEQWKVELNPDCKPSIQVSKLYTDLMKTGSSGKDKTYLKDCYQEAKWFIKSLNSRNETLLKVASKIVEYQRGFFDHGPEAMKPLVLHDIAEAIEMHESTVSRVTNQKYMHTPQGIFELKYFFSSHVSTSSGGECSSTAIRALIKKLIGSEDPGKPLSDSKIAKQLDEQGINVARRTVAKYRESMKIPPSNERKQLI